MVPLILIGLMAVVAGFWVKTRRARKARQVTYAGSN
jgi:hypothetical protein